MAASGSSLRELSSWKEIAAYLDVSIRTAQVWERERGLPVRRLPGGRGPVLISVAELDAWKHSAKCDQPASSAPDVLPAIEAMRVAPIRTFQWSWRTVVPGVALAIALVAGLAAAWLRHSPVPAGYRLEQGSLVVLDARGRELWRKPFGGIANGAYDRDRFVQFVDLDNDGSKEVLVVSVAAQREGEQPLICYAADGTERWRFVPGRTVRTATETFTPPFHALWFAVARLGKEGAVRIVVASQHYLYYPTQVALLSTSGKVLREYWHSGGLAFPLVTEVGGASRLLLAGVHNATKSATLVALDPDTMSGASAEENPSYQLLGFAPGREAMRLFFPRSCMNLLLEPFAIVGGLWREQGEIDIEVQHRLTPNTGASVFYHLNPDLGLQRMTLGSSFEKSHGELVATHVLDHRFSRAEENALRNITYLSPSHVAAK